MPRVSYAAAAALLVLATASAAATTTYCPRPLHRATRLMIVVTPDMNSSQATLRVFERTLPSARWKQIGEAEPAVVAEKGLGWAPTFKHYARDKEAVKQERDKRTPAGIFRFGMSFGLKPVANKDHVNLEKGVHFCVDDVRSPFYGHIVRKTKIGASVTGEEMAAMEAYRRGLMIDYPRRRLARAGSCIFLQVWDAPGKLGSAGVGLPEERVEHFQTWAKRRHTLIAIVPEPALDRFKGCLPLNMQVSRNETPAALPERNPLRNAPPEASPPAAAATVTTEGSSTPSSGKLEP